MSVIGTIGFTGTQKGMTEQQQAKVEFLLHRLQDRGAVRVRHGVCVGADEEFHEIAASQWYVIVGHPGMSQYGSEWKRASVTCSELLPAKPFLTRNRDIVEQSDVLLATPSGPEVLRSGTWATVRWARKCQKPLLLIWPEGTVQFERLNSDTLKQAVLTPPFMTYRQLEDVE